MKEQPRRKSIRLRDYDYSAAGAYFITIVTLGRRCLFGEVADTEMQLNEAGSVIERLWLDLPERFPSVRVDAHIVMPNHIHGLLHLAGSDGHVGAPLVGAREPGQQTVGTDPPLLGDIVGAYKSLSTNAYNDGVKRLGWRRFERRLWQRNYYEHIVRDEESLARIREYIVANPGQWSEDPENDVRSHDASNRNRSRLTTRETWMV